MDLGVHCMVSYLYEVPKVVRSETESRMVFARGWGGGARNGEMVVEGHELPVIR